MIGSKALAQIISQVETQDDCFVDEDTIPEGWKYLDSGAYRHAFIGPDGNVYKVQYDSEGLNHNPNLNEWEEYAFVIEHQTTNIRIPVTHYFADCNVIVMEYIPNDDTFTVELARAVYKLGQSMAYTDWEGDNIRVHNGIAYVIDFAM